MLMPTLFDLPAEADIHANEREWQSMEWAEKMAFQREFNVDAAHNMTQMFAVFIEKNTGTRIAFVKPSIEREGIRIIMKVAGEITSVTLPKDVYETLCFYLSAYNDCLHRIRTRCLFSGIETYGVPTVDNFKEKAIHFTSAPEKE